MLTHLHGMLAQATPRPESAGMRDFALALQVLGAITLAVIVLVAIDVLVMARDFARYIRLKTM